MEAVFLSPYSTNLNVAENSISRVKSHVRKPPPRTFGKVWLAAHPESRRITAKECVNYIKASGYRASAVN